MAKISLDDFRQIVSEQLPFARTCGFEILDLDAGRARARAPYHEDFLRPGGTISGPILMGLADFAMYGAVLSLIGRVELAVTTNLNINFLNRPQTDNIIGEARILKLGKRLAVGEVSLTGETDAALVAHVTATYSIPP